MTAAHDHPWLIVAALALIAAALAGCGEHNKDLDKAINYDGTHFTCTYCGREFFSDEHAVSHVQEHWHFGTIEIVPTPVCTDAPTTKAVIRYADGRYWTVISKGTPVLNFPALLEDLPKDDAPTSAPATAHLPTPDELGPDCTIPIPLSDVELDAAIDLCQPDLRGIARLAEITMHKPNPPAPPDRYPDNWPAQPCYKCPRRAEYVTSLGRFCGEHVTPRPDETPNQKAMRIYNERRAAPYVTPEPIPPMEQWTDKTCESCGQPAKLFWTGHGTFCWNCYGGVGWEKEPTND